MCDTASITLYQKSRHEDACNALHKEHDIIYHRQSKHSSFYQIRAALIANSAVIHLGLMFSFSAIALPQLQSKDSPISVNSDQSSWIASIASFATPPGCILGGILMDKFGRRTILLALSVPCIAGWVLLGSAGLLGSKYPSLVLPAMYIARICQGVGTGLIAGVSRVYTSEISQPRLRGSLCSLASLGVSTGVLLGYTLGAIFSWPVMALLSTLLPITSLMLSFVFLPETPTWLLQNKQIRKAKNSLVRLRDPNCSSHDIDEELLVLGGDIDVGKLSKMKILANRSTIKPLSMLILYFCIYQFSGISVLTFYNVNIIEKTGAKLNGYVTAVMFGSIRLVCNIIGCFLLTLCDRRVLTILSGVTSGIALLSLGAHGYFTQNINLENESWYLRYFPIGCIISFYVTFALGFLLVPWILLGELYPAKIRGFLGGVTACFAHIFLFAAIKSFPFILENLKFFGAFWFYGGTLTVGSIILFLVLPETRGKTLLEIECLFKQKRRLTSH